MLRIASKADSEEKFIQLFSPFCQADSFFIVTRKPKSEGTETRFAIHLQGGEPIITGVGTVEAAYTDRNNPFKLPGMKLRFIELYGKSAKVINRLVAANQAKDADVDAADVDAAVDGIVATAPQLASGAAAVARPPRTALGTQPGAIRSEALTALSGASSRAGSEADTADAPKEERVKGSDYILPANPFGELTDNVLEAFVECSLYEDIASGNPEGDKEPANLPDWWADRAALGASNSGGFGRIPTSDLGPYPPAGALMAEGVAPQPVVGRPGYPRAPTPGVAPQMRPGTAGPYPAPGTAPLLGAQAAPPSNRTTVIAIAAAVVATLVSLMIGYLIWGDDDSEDSSDPTGQPATRPENPEPPDESPTPDTPEKPKRDNGDGDGDEKPKPADKAPATGTPPTVEKAVGDADALCETIVTSQPAGASVSLGGDSLGETPLERELPCGDIELSFSKERRAPLRKAVTLTPSQLNQVEVRLQRPKVELTVTSKPDGATVKLDGKSVGKTPLTTTVDAFRSVQLEVKKSGHRRYKKKLKPGAEGATIDARLKKRRR